MIESFSVVSLVSLVSEAQQRPEVNWAPRTRFSTYIFHFIRIVSRFVCPRARTTAALGVSSTGRKSLSRRTWDLVRRRLVFVSPVHLI